MVKIVEMTEKEIEDVKRFSELEKIAKETFPNAIIDTIGFSIGVRFIRHTLQGMIHVDSSRNTLYINEPEALDNAMTLAKAYEDRLKIEYIVKKEYIEEKPKG